MEQKLKGGVLIIGSLLWDINQGDKIGFRKKWRNMRLLMNEKIHVKAPIRYGRLSSTKQAENFTMVFSKECESIEKSGTAYLIPLKREVIRSFTGIVNQARFLSEVEGSNNKKLCKGKNEKWCTIGISFNPNFEKELKSMILQKWKNLIVNDGGLKDFSEYKIGTEKSILSSEGEILMKWPQAINSNNQETIDEFDFIIATCTKPNLNCYPNIEQIQEKIKHDKRKYFYNNIENGIVTFQDNEIKSKLLKSMEIAKGIQNTEWHKLNLKDPDSKDWDKAIEIFTKRLNERFIEPVDKLIEVEKGLMASQKKYGIAALAIDCMLIETLQAFYEGKTDARNKSEQLFINFLTKREVFKKHFTSEELAKTFYSHFRCGILHQTETKKGAKVWAVGELLMQNKDGLTINRIAFHQGIKTELEKYIDIIRNKKNVKERDNFIKKMDFISRK